MLMVPAGHARHWLCPLRSCGKGRWQRLGAVGACGRRCSKQHWEANTAPHASVEQLVTSHAMCAHRPACARWKHLAHRRVMRHATLPAASLEPHLIRPDLAGCAVGGAGRIGVRPGAAFLAGCCQVYAASNFAKVAHWAQLVVAYGPSGVNVRSFGRLFAGIGAPLVLPLAQRAGQAGVEATARRIRAWTAHCAVAHSVQVVEVSGGARAAVLAAGHAAGVDGGVIVADAAHELEHVAASAALRTIGLHVCCD